MSPDALRAQADTLAHRAYRLRQKAEHLEAMEQWRERQEEIASIVRSRCAGLSLRDTPEKSAELLAADLRELLPWVTAEHAAAMMKAELARSTRYSRAMRDREIMRLARLGWCNREIAQHVGLKNPKSVSRIVQRDLKRWR